MYVKTTNFAKMCFCTNILNHFDDFVSVATEQKTYFTNLNIIFITIELVDESIKTFFFQSLCVPSFSDNISR